MVFRRFAIPGRCLLLLIAALSLLVGSVNASSAHASGIGEMLADISEHGHVHADGLASFHGHPHSSDVGEHSHEVPGVPICIRLMTTTIAGVDYPMTQERAASRLKPGFERPPRA